MAESEPSFRAAVERGLSLRAPVTLGRPRGLSDADEQALVWLALAPAWTVPLAEACGFPSQSGSVKADLERLRASGLCLRNRAGVEPDDEGDTEVDGLLQQQYWMSVNGRKEVVQRVLNDPRRGVVYVHDQIHAIGRAISVANRRGVPVSATVVRWATLADVPDTRGMAERLTREVEAQLAAGQTGSVLRWVEAARSLEELLPGELRPAMDRASRGLELFHRREDDERLLGPFVERPEQIEAFDKLTKGPDSLWSLHYIGAGGLGKTMLMRYITARLAPSLNAATARVDFDFLNPDYPARAG